MVTVDTLARLRAVQAASRDTYARSVAAEAANEIERLRARIAELEAAIAFADRQTEKVEALLDPHIKWETRTAESPTEGAYVVAFEENMK